MGGGMDRAPPTALTWSLSLIIAGTWTCNYVLLGPRPNAPFFMCAFPPCTETNECLYISMIARRKPIHRHT